MPSRKKGGQRLLELARKRRQKAAKDKAGKLAPMVIEPTLSKLRTGTTSKRKKGGQRLLDLARRRKKPAAKPASSQPRKFGARIPVGSRSSATKAQKPKRKGPPSLPKKMEIGKSKPKSMSRIDLKSAEEAMKLGAGGGLGKLAAAGIGAGALKLYQLGKRAHAARKLKRAEDARKAAAKAKRAAAAAKKAEEAKKGVSGIGQARAASAASRTSGLGKAKPKAKAKAKKKKKSAAQIKRESMRGGSQWR
jgi:colicin import membrane protein